MDTGLFQRHAESVRAAFAGGLGCDAAAFSAETLTIVDRPEPPVWPYTALAATLGTGTVLSLDSAYRDFAEANLPAQHYRAAHPAFLDQIAQEAARRGAAVRASAPGVGFTLAFVPAEPRIPEGLELLLVDAKWMAEEQRNGRFENGVGEPGIGGRAERNQFGYALFNETGEPLAVGGVFLYLGLHEIGVDVVRSHRGLGIGRLVVEAAARGSLERGGVPVYFCAATNIRSQRTALASGFLPVCSDAVVS